MMIPSPIPMISAGGSGPSGPLYVVKRILQVAQYTDYVEYLESTVTDRAALYALVHAVDPSIPLSAVMIDRVVVGGGGGGMAMEGGYGGFPGVVKRDTIRLADLSADSSIHIEIGAGGLGGNDFGLQGSNSSFSEYNTNNSLISDTFIKASGGFGGSSEEYSVIFYWREYTELGVILSDPTYKSTYTAAGCHTGPGCGAYAAGDSLIVGGVGTRGEEDGFYQCGSGGDYYGSGMDGNPGYQPGGGGGSCSAGNTAGAGGDGIVRLRFWIMETVQ